MSKFDTDELPNANTAGSQTDMGLAARNSPITISVHEFCRLTSLSRTSAYKLMDGGDIQSVRRLGRRLILMSSVQDFLQVDAEGPDQ